MHNKTFPLAIVLLILCGQATADDKAKTAVAAGAGAAIGAVVGDELGDRNGAIVGSAIGAAVGAAIATDSDKDRHRHSHADLDVIVTPAVVDTHPHGRHCPPGQRKKGRC